MVSNRFRKFISENFPARIFMLILLCAPQLFSQSTFTWTGGSGNWTNSANWTISGDATGYPDEVGDIVSFTNNSGTYDIATPTAGNGTAVTGFITTNGAGTVRLGNNSTFAGSLTLNATVGAPVLAVNTGRLAIFTELIGSQGFRKTGNGTLNFFSNTLNMTNLTGDVSIEDGTVWFNQAGNFGSGNLSFSGSNTLFQHRGNFTTTFAANQNFTISSGSIINIYNQATLSGMVINGAITGSGNLTFTNGNFTLNGANTFSGNTTLAASGNTTSVNIILGSGSNLSPSSLSFTSLGSASLNLGGNSQTIQNLITESSNAGSIMTLSNGSLTISGGGDISLGGRGGSFTLSLANLDSFSAGSASSNFTFHSGDTLNTTTNTLILSTNGTNTITGQSVIFGRIKAGGNSSGTAYSANVNLGKTNTINADVFKVGSTNATAALAFQAGLSNPSLILRSVNGASAMREWVIGESTADTGARSGQGTVDLLGGTIDALLGNLTVGLNNNASVTSTSWLKISNGNLTADTIRLATKSGSSAVGVSGAIYQSGGTVSTQTLEFGQSGAGNSTITALYDMSGGRLEAGLIQVGGGNFTSSSNRTLAMSGNAILSNLAGSNLTINGSSSQSGALLNLNINGSAVLLAANGSISLGVNTQLTGSGALTKNGSGNLILAGTSNFAGTTTINSGTLVVESNQTLGALAGAGYISLSNGTLTLNSSTSSDFSGGISGFGSLTKSGSSALSLSGSNSYTGTTTVLGGTLTAGHVQALPQSALALGGGTLNLGGNTQSVTSLSTVSGGSGNASITGGSLIINSSAANTITGLANGANLDLSGLSAFSFSGLSSEFALQAGSNSSVTPSGFILSTTGTNTITANQTRLGGAATTSLNSLNLALGKTNNIFTQSLTIGYSSSTDMASSTAVSFQASSSNATLQLRAADGTTALPNWTIGHTLGASKAGSGVVDLSGGTIDAVVTNLTIGLHSTNTAVSDNSSLTIASGTLTAETITLAEKTTDGSMALTSTLNQSGGEVVARNLILGKGGNSTSAQFVPTYNLNGGVLYAETITAAAGIFNNSTSSRTIALGNATLRNYSGANLTIGGLDASAGGRVRITIGGTAVFSVDAEKNITLGAHSLLSGSGNFTKNGAGDLVIGGNLSQTYSGTANLAEGRLIITSGSMASATINITGGNLSGNTTLAGIRISSPTVFDIEEGQRLSASTTFSGSQSFSKNGSGELLIGSGGSQTYNGTATLNAGRLTVNSTMASTSIALNSGTLAGNGSVGSVSLNGASSFDIGTSQTLAATSIFSGSANFSKIGNGTLTISDATAYTGTATISAGNLTINSNMTSGTLNLNGGNLSGNGTLGTVNLNSTSTINIPNPNQLILGSNGGINGSANLIKAGNGTLTLNNATGYTGTATVSAGNLTINSNMTSATLNLSGGNLSGNGTLGTVNLNSTSTINIANSNRLSVGSSGSINGSANLIKTGGGTLAFNASTNQTYSGAITLSAGTLIVHSNMTNLGTTTLSAANATLEGTGTLGNVTLSNGVISPGESTIGTLSMRNLSWSAAGQIRFDLSTNSTLSDQVAILGNFTRANSGNFTFNLTGGQESTTYTLVTWTGTTNFTANNFAASGQTGNFSITSNQLQFTTVPEPSISGFFAFTGMATLLWRSAKRRNGRKILEQKKSNHC